MSGTGESTADFAGEERAFRIRLGEIRRIEQKGGEPIGAIVQRLAKAALLLQRRSQVPQLELLAAGIEIRSDDVREVIYQGLVGAGMNAGEATPLVRREIDDRGLPGLLDNVGAALVALVAAQSRPADDEPGEPTAGMAPPDSSTSPPSTGSAPPSA